MGNLYLDGRREQMRAGIKKILTGLLCSNSIPLDFARGDQILTEWENVTLSEGYRALTEWHWPLGGLSYRNVGLFFILYLLFSSPGMLRAGAAIALPPPPQMMVPPDIDEGDADREIQDRSEKRKNEFERGKKKPSLFEKQEKKLSEESHKKRELSFFVKMGILFPYILIDPPRKNYTAEPGNSVLVMNKFQEEDEKKKRKMWLGARILALSGSAEYKEKPARYGFVYWGPALGFAKIDAVGESSPVDKLAARTVEEEQKELASLSTLKMSKGFLFLMGLSLQTRLGAYDASAEKDLKGELDSKAISRDGTGLWCELSYFTLHYGSLAVHYDLGLQLGKGKKWILAGVSISTWY
ncbi:MAG: hypothetical protein KA436_00670 [Oligoflexales bacterium]|nr:hypothetical protein [Oligoflexales bacterium]